MEGSPGQNINEDGGYKSGDLSDGETPATKASEIDEKLEEVAQIKMFTRLKEDIFQLSVRGDIPVQRRSNIKEIEEKATMEMNVKGTAFGKYDLVLQKTQQEQLDKCKEALRMFPYFGTWSDATVMECCALSKIERYELDQTILGDGKGKQNFVYFILKGQCQMIQHLELAVREINRHKYFRLHSEEVSMRPNEHLESYLMQVCLMNKGECFDIGKSEFKTSVEKIVNLPFAVYSACIVSGT
ncbi:hypothetical protein B7P43_G03562 [Cryptotermes secundus]|uniref:Cyclic nucleotide-binding domain-containing protein n=1 Tax=Cryptotermes secundus TaxID=105785 RepID=A0A2J7PCK5_9NEOP|nr:hypothetical protein B7P43_G03562 [Cryptotermes secundus]